MAATGAIGHHILFNTCEQVNTIRSMYMDATARMPLNAGTGYFHANNASINNEQEFAVERPCASGGQTKPVVSCSTYLWDSQSLQLLWSRG